MILQVGGPRGGPGPFSVLTLGRRCKVEALEEEMPAQAHPSWLCDGSTIHTSLRFTTCRSWGGQKGHQQPMGTELGCSESDFTHARERAALGRWEGQRWHLIRRHDDACCAQGGCWASSRHSQLPGRSIRAAEAQRTSSQEACALLFARECSPSNWHLDPLGRHCVAQPLFPPGQRSHGQTQVL